MQSSHQSKNSRIWRIGILWLYRAGLSFYPKSYRGQFSSEMIEVFEEALEEQLQTGWLAAILFVNREIVELPISITRQYLQAKNNRLKVYIVIGITYSLGFTLLGLVKVLRETHSLIGAQGHLIKLINYITIGGLSGLTLGIIIAPHKRRPLALCGMIFFTFVWIYPNLIISCIFYLLVILVLWNWRGLLRLIGYSSLAVLGAYMINRLSAALVQCYVFHSPSQTIAQTGPMMIIIPYLFAGVFLGLIFTRITPKSLTI